MSEHGPYFRIVTYDLAAKWLRLIGGTHSVQTLGPREHYVVVTVRSALGPEVSRRAIFDPTMTGFAGEQELRRAFLAACDELRLALS